MDFKNKNNKIFLDISRISLVFTKERINYILKLENQFHKLFKKLKLLSEIKNNEILVSTTEFTRDPCAIMKGKSILSVLSRGCDLETAILFYKNDETFYEIINIEMETKSRNVMISRRNRLLQPNTLKAIEELTECKLFVYGKTVTVVGNYSGVKECSKIVMSCMKNKHPVYELRRLMVKKELQENKNLKNENWENLLPEVKKKAKKNN